MGNGQQQATEKRRYVKQRPAGDIKGSTVHAAADKLRSIYIYVNEAESKAKDDFEKKQGGTVTFVGANGNKLTALLIKAYFPAGTWYAKLSDEQVLDELTCAYPPDQDQKVIDTLHERAKTELLITWAQRAGALRQIERLLRASLGLTIRIVVSYERAVEGNPKSLPEKLPVTAGDNSVLADPEVAMLYLLFVEHFGRVPIDTSLARGGLTEKEIAQVEQDRPQIIEITDLFVQAFTEFQSAKGTAADPPPGLDSFDAMTEAIFYQRYAQNDLARRNMLAIGIGKLLLRSSDGTTELIDDIGVLRRGASSDHRLLYDRFGAAVLGYMGPLDTEYRSIDMTKVERESSIPRFSIQVQDESLYRFLRSLEQQFADPVHELEALASSLYKHIVFIANEIARRYNGEIRERIIEFAPIVIGFFVAHAVVAHLIRRGHPAAAALMVLLKGAGLLFGIDFVLINMKRLADAGHHFARIEELNRSTEGEPKLTRLSERHLRMGAAALLDAMADFIAMGVLILGSIGVKKGIALLRGIQQAKKARSKLTIEDNRVVEIEPLKAETTIPARIENPLEAEAGLETPARKASRGKPPEAHPVEESTAHITEGRRAAVPEQAPFEAQRPRALDQTPEEFAVKSNEAAQRELYEACKEAVPRQQAFIDALLAELKLEGAEARSQVKRESFDEFRDGVIDKTTKRKNYETVSDMHDMIRGRIDVEKPEQVEIVFEALVKQKRASVVDQAEPDVRVGVENGYPRYHIDVVDPNTGIAHEWQIGTKATTRLYETTGIDVGKVNIKPENRNIHDVEYDVFKALHEPPEKLGAKEVARRKQLAVDTGIPEYRRKVAEVSARTLEEDIPTGELEATIKQLHKEASAILKDVVERSGGDPKGIEFVESLLH